MTGADKDTQAGSHVVVIAMPPGNVVPTEEELSRIVRRHERHVCTSGHGEPGICAHDQMGWPCDTVLVLSALRSQERTR